MGLCWSEPPVAPVQRTYVVENPKASAPPMPAYQNPNYTYAMPPQQQWQPQQQQQQQPQYVPNYQVYPYQQQQQQNRVSPAGAFLGGLVVASVLDNIMDPE
jgi:hypothetical protein